MELKVEYISPEKLTAYERNARKHEDYDIDAIAASIEKFGFDDPIGIWGKKNLVVEGHGRLLAAKKLGLDSVPVIRLDHLSDEERRAYALAHNKTAELSKWDQELLALELGDIGMDMTDFGFLDDLSTENDIDEELDGSRYSQKVKIPHYEPTGELPSIADMLDTSKADELIEEINEANIPDDVRDFLTYAAYRHNVFNYRNIAEFYAHQEPEVQRLMEKSALVIIDIDDAIANGYVRLTKTIQDIIEGDGDEG